MNNYITVKKFNMTVEVFGKSHDFKLVELGQMFVDRYLNNLKTPVRREQFAKSVAETGLWEITESGDNEGIELLREAFILKQIGQRATHFNVTKKDSGNFSKKDREFLAGVIKNHKLTIDNTYTKDSDDGESVLFTGYDIRITWTRAEKDKE